MGDLTMGSLFDGSGGFPLGALLSGIMPIWASEIEPFPIRVTTKRLPFMKHYGDINRINGAEIEPVDIITFGSPCVGMSVAGKREGLKNDQSILFYEAIRVIKEMRCATNGRYPRFIVWENVPGAYSSAGGGDFREVLSKIVKIKSEGLSVPMPESGKWVSSGEVVGDGFSVAFRCVDAQFWGVAQRRRRCYLVADFAGECAGKILFESEGVSGYTPQGFGAGQGTAAYAEGGARAAGMDYLTGWDHQEKRVFTVGGIAPTLSGSDSGGYLLDNRVSDIQPEALAFEPGAVSRLGGHAWDGTAGTLRADMGDNQLAVAMPSAGFMGGQGTKAGSIGYGEETSPTIKGESGGNSTPCVLVPGRLTAAIENRPADSQIKLDGSGTMRTLNGRMGTGGGNVPLVTNDAPLLAYDCRNHAASDVSATLQSKNNGGQSLNYINPVIQEYTVRRLVPMECALLQGFPPDWCANLETSEPTEADIAWWSEVFEAHRIIMGTSSKPKSRKQIIKWLQNPYSDTAEYKMWGNGVALPCVRFVMAGIAWIAGRS